MHKNILDKAKIYVNKLLMPLENHYYHQYEHALEVMTRAMYLGKEEGLSEDEIEMLGLAGIFHDTGFIIQYDKNEPIGASIAENFLKGLLYPKDKIKQIKKIILITDPEYKNPKNIYEKIIKDADLDNLGREDFFLKTNSLKKELETIKSIKIKDPDWHHGALDLLYNHVYYTETQGKERQEKKEKNEKLLEKIVRAEKVKNNIKVNIEF